VQSPFTKAIKGNDNNSLSVWKGDLPPGITRIDAPTPWILIQPRVHMPNHAAVWSIDQRLVHSAAYNRRS
jgi:hypothetical protein